MPKTTSAKALEKPSDAGSINRGEKKPHTQLPPRYHKIIQIINKHKNAALLPKKMQVKSLNWKYYAMTVNYHQTFKNCLKNETQMSQDFYHVHVQ